MSVYSNKYNFIFIHIPKNAGSTFVQNYTDGKNVKSFEKLNAELGFKRDPVYGNHFTYQMIKSLIDKNKIDLDYDSCLKFCVVRNPWERMVSLYQHRLRKIDKTFMGKPRNSEKDKALLREGFVPWLLKTEHVSDSVLTITPQLHWITNEKGLVTVDKIIDIKNYDKELDEIIKKLGMPESKRKNFNRSKKDSSSYKNMYNTKARKYIEKHFEKDIDMFKFSF